MKKIVASVLVGGALAVAAMLAYEAYREVADSAPASLASVQKPLMSFSVDPSWIISGTPNFRNTETVRLPDGKSVSGLWACDGPSSFVWTFYMDETIHLLEGKIDIDYQNRHFSMRPGDTATFHAGTNAVWHVPEHAKKSYTLHHPGRLTLLWRRLVRMQT